ncbi:hypothetical protein [Actinoplanes sp. NPDC051494]|uniref:hypothetical protein n=1 Tax=Actinoplanes sp. NPDC051494 TaxID=3363907 RepID=UPI0037A9820D
MTGTERRAVPDRARKRATRALAAKLGVPYSVASRLLTAPTTARSAHLPPAFPIGTGDHRAWMFAERERRPFHTRVGDTRMAADLPLGRATHLTARFPPLRLPPGAMYDGEHRRTVLAMLYAVVTHESPALLPAAEELAWAAELGEEAAVDIACAAADRAARFLFDEDRWQFWTRVEAALAAGEAGPDRHARDAAIALGGELRSVSLRDSLDGARHILDALLVETHGCLPPGARVRFEGADATVTGAVWTSDGPPTGYEVRLDTDPATHVVAVDDLTAEPTAEPAGAPPS